MPALYQGWVEAEKRVGTGLSLIPAAVLTWAVPGYFLVGGGGSYVEEWFLPGTPHPLSES